MGEKNSETGYHRISSVMQAVSLFDYITFSEAESTTVEGSQIRGNIVESAMKALSSRTGRAVAGRIVCHKTIPSAAGMGGGSSDAAMVLNLANLACGLGLTTVELQEVAQEVGSDVAFLVAGGRAVVEGIKKQTIKQIEAPDLHYLIAHPRVELSTKEMYDAFDREGKSFLAMAGERCPDVPMLLEQMAPGAEESGMTGKGPTVFAGYDSFNKASAAWEKIAGWFKGDVFIARSLQSMACINNEVL